MTIKNKKLLTLSIALGFSLILLLGVIFYKNNMDKLPQAQAVISTSNELHGWAWSSNVGWISFNCYEPGFMNVCGTSNYKTTLDFNNGKLAGFAWSSNIGWIDVNPQNGFPQPPNHGLQFDLVSGKFTGWAKALSASGNGWDGWIKITDGQIGTGVNTGRIVSSINPNDGGWAWGSNVVGWLKFYDASFSNFGVKVPTLACNFSAAPSNIIPPQKSALKWECNALAAAGNSCSLSSFGSKPSDGTQEVRPTITTTYTLVCNGFGGPITNQTTVTVGNPATPTKIIETNPR